MHSCVAHLYVFIIIRHFIKAESVVLRDGEKTVVDDKDLVVGDIIFLQEGQRVPADARVLLSNNMRIDESILTGEALASEKNSETIEQTVLLGDRKNSLFKGTYVVAGSGKAIVTAIGADTEIGKIHIITCLFLFIVGIFTGKPIKELLVMLTALFICVVPEGLPVVLTLVLVGGALHMAKQFVLVRNMQAVEALGRTDVIVIDKTGTLTRNEMIVSRVWTDGDMLTITGQGYHGILNSNPLYPLNLKCLHEPSLHPKR